MLAGDAAHTTHFTIGSGTKLAIEDAIGLAAALGDHDDLGTALDAYERDRKASLLLLQREARNSARWFESLPRYIDLGPEQFATLLHQRRSQLLTRMSPSGYYRLRRSTENSPSSTGCGTRPAAAAASARCGAGRGPRCKARGGWCSG